MAEGTNNPGNPQPPINQDGMALPNSSPSNSLGESGSNALDGFFKEIEALKKSVENSNKTLEKQKALQEKLNQVFFKQEKLNKETLKSQEALRKETDKYKDSEGKWAKGTEAIQAKYEDDLKELSNCVSEAEKEFSDATDALYENTKAIGDERDNRVSSLKTIEEFRKAVEQADSSLGEELKTNKEYIETQKLVIDANKSIAQKTDDSTKSIDKLNREIRKQTLEENKKTKEQKYEGVKLQDDDFSTDLISKGGFTGLSDIKKQIEEIALAENERFKTYNPDATEDEIKTNKEKFIKSSKDILINRIETKNQTNTTGNKEEDKKILKNQTDQLVSLESIDGNGLLAISKMEEDQIRAQEEAAENKGNAPIWAEELLDESKKQSKSLHGILGEEIKGNKKEGWLWWIIKTVLFIIGAVVLAGIVIVAYGKGIFSKIGEYIKNAVFAFFKMIPGLLVKTMNFIFEFITKGWKGMIKGKIIDPILNSIFGVFKTIYDTVKKGIKLAQIFYAFFKGGFMGVFKMLYTSTTKVFFWVGMIISIINGIFQGFKKMANLKGILMGAVAGLISFFTFGFVDIGTAFDKLNDWFSGIFDALTHVFQPLIDFFVKAYQIVMETFHKIVSIFQGEGSIFGKLWKTICVLIVATVKQAINTVVAVLKTVFALIVTLPMAIGEWIGNLLLSIGTYITDGVIWFSNWIMSGAWMGDLANFGTWIYEALVDLFANAITAIADGLGDLPFVGGYIKEALGGGSGDSALVDATKTAGKIIDESKNVVEEIATVSSNQESDDFGSKMSNSAYQNILHKQTISLEKQNTDRLYNNRNYSSNQVTNSSNSTSMAKQQANAQSAVVVNSPTTNVSNGGGNSAPVIMPMTATPTNQPWQYQGYPRM